MSYCGAGEQDVLCINERQVMVRSKSMYDHEPPNTSLEGVRSDLMKRYEHVVRTYYIICFHIFIICRYYTLVTVSLTIHVHSLQANDSSGLRRSARTALEHT